MEQFMIMVQNDNGFSLSGPMDRKEVEARLAEANEMDETIFTVMPEMMGGEMVDQGICVLKVEVCSPKAVQVVTKFEF
jgi:hypothetical protein